MDMAIGPRVRMGPPPRSFAADAHDCIMVQVENITCRIQVCGASARASWQAPLGSNAIIVPLPGHTKELTMLPLAIALNHDVLQAEPPTD